MEENKEVVQKIDHLTRLMNNPNRNEGSVLRIFNDLFQLTREGRDLLPETSEWLSEKAKTFLSPELLMVLMKLRLEIYAFHFASLNFTEVVDVIDDLSNGETLKNIKSFPTGAFNKIKRELLGSLQQNSLNQPPMESASSIAATEGD